MEVNSMTLNELIKLCMQPLITYLNNYYLQAVEKHCIRSAEFERQRASEAWKNVAYYQMKAVRVRAEMK